MSSQPGRHDASATATSSASGAGAKSDIQSRDDIKRMVEGFYQTVLSDERLAPIFLEVAAVDLAEHLPRIRAYWEKMLLGSDGYRRHTMDIHRRLDRRRRLQRGDFERWVQLFVANVDRQFAGPVSERAKQLATTIAFNMQNRLKADRRRAGASPPPEESAGSAHEIELFGDHLL